MVRMVQQYSLGLACVDLVVEMTYDMYHMSKLFLFL